MPKGLIDAIEAAARMGVTPQSVRDADFRKVMGIPAIRIGRVLRFRPEDVEDAIIRREEVFGGQDSGKEERTHAKT